MIIFKISDDVEKDISKVDPHGRIVGDWDFNIPEKKYSKGNLVNFLSKMLKITGPPYNYLTSILYDRQSKELVKEWKEGDGDVLEWIKILDIDESRIELNPYDYRFNILLQSNNNKLHEIKDGGLIGLTYEHYFKIVFWIKVNVFSERIWAGFNEELNQPNKLLLGEEYASYNRKVLAEVISKIREDFGVKEPTTFESENMTGICETGFKDGCYQFRY